MKAQRLKFNRLILAGILVVSLVRGSVAHSQTAPDDLATLKRLVEEQNRKIDALNQKVQQLEQREQARSAAPAVPQLPAIVIDTNGVPIGTTTPRTEQLELKVRALEEKQELDERVAAERASQLPLISIGENGFLFRSADTNFVLRFRGILQVDTRAFLGDNPFSSGNDTLLIRRARPILEGTVFRDFNFQFMPDFAGTTPQLFEAWLNYRYRPELQLRAGKIRGTVGLENLFLDSLLLFNERSLVNAMIPSVNPGIELWGDISEGTFTYAAGIFNGDGDGRAGSNTDFSDDKVFGARVFLKPFNHSDHPSLQGIGFGVGSSFGRAAQNAAGLPSTTGGTVPGYFTAGQQQFFAYNPLVGPVVADGVHWRVCPQATYTWGPLGLLGEYVISDQGLLNATTLQRAEVQNKAWQIAAQWVLTGEPAGFNGIAPSHPFDPLTGGWGAWQLLGRFSRLDIDPVAFQGFSNPTLSASSAASWSLGLNWWLNRNIRFSTSFSHTQFGGGGAVNPIDPTTTIPPATVSHQAENVVFTRIQLAF